MADSEMDKCDPESPSMLSGPELVQRVDELSRFNAAKKAENELFERFLSRLDPKDLEPLAPTKPSLGVSQTEVSQPPKRLTMDQKCYIAQLELAEMEKDMQRSREESEAEIDHYKAIIEAADIRLLEIKKDRRKFERDFVKPLQEKKGDMMVAQKVTHYFQDRTRAKETLVESLRLKNAALREQLKKLEMQLKEKEQRHEAPHKRDKLEKEKRKLKEELHEKDKELQVLNLKYRNMLQVLKSNKKQLQNAMCESDRLDREISAQNEMLVKLDSECLQAEKERAEAEAENQRLHSQLSEYQVPDVLEYAKCIARHHELEQSVRVWERKVKIAEGQLTT
ncbi:cilia- and flagella-associated protein 263 [Amia ocellicauda]|uniref:cilia- and flagella-associated protein 263 n=1 Tax=Amia ocellicauda TaxID=2972642 RepID=UPI003464B433